MPGVFWPLHTSVLPKSGSIWQHAHENWLALVSPAGCPVPRCRGPFHALGISRSPRKRAKTTKPTWGPSARVHYWSRVEGGIVAGHLTPSFQVAEAPKDGSGLSWGTNVSLVQRLVQSSERHHLRWDHRVLLARESGFPSWRPPGTGPWKQKTEQAGKRLCPGLGEGPAQSTKARGVEYRRLRSRRHLPRLHWAHRRRPGRVRT